MITHEFDSVAACASIISTFTSKMKDFSRSQTDCKSDNILEIAQYTDVVTLDH